MTDLLKTENNNIGFLRLFFASAVIIGHAPELVDGTRVREPLTVFFGTMSLGEVAVDAFFILSGYLITQSMNHSRSVVSFLGNRIVRIYPAFIVSSILSVYAFGAMFGGKPLAAGLQPLFTIARLLPPEHMANTLVGLPYPIINGAMWTIAYEFRCYLLAAFLGFFGLLERPRFVIALALTMMAIFVLQRVPAVHNGIMRADNGFLETMFDISPFETIRFMTAFTIGSSFRVWRESAVYKIKRTTVIVASIVAISALAGPYLTAEPGLLIGGGVILFWASFRASFGWLQRINVSWDISYGTYLYGWPIATTVIWIHPRSSPWLVACTTLPVAWCMGAMSWWIVEKPILRRWRAYLAGSIASQALQMSASITDQSIWKPKRLNHASVKMR